MKNLKRALSFALASVMVIGMMVVGAGAADFTDADKIVNDEAVNTLVALNVINGKEDGSYFDPTGTLTRAEAAKLIVYILHGGKAPVIGTKATPTFTDIKGTWAEAYIEYCTSTGVIAGKGDGTFGPTDTLTGSALAKMLLVAMGYDATVFSLTGASWEINTNVEANKIGLYEDLESIDPSAVITRDNAAQMIYNALFAGTMSKDYNYNITDGTLTNGYSFNSNKTLYKDKFGGAEFEAVLVGASYDSKKDTYTYTFDDDTTFKSADDYTDLFMLNVKVLYKPATTNTEKKTYGMYAEDSKIVATGLVSDIAYNKKAGEIKVDGTVFKYEDKTITDLTTIPAYAFLSGTKTNVKDAQASAEMYVVDLDGNDKVDYIVYKPFTVGEVTYVNKTSFKVDKNAAVKLEDVVAYDGVAKNDFVKITAAANTTGTKDVYEKIDDVIEGKVTGVKDGEAKINGTWYDLAIANLTLGTTYKKMPVVNGFVFAATVKAASVDANDYAVVTKYAAPYGLTTYAQAELLLTDGTKVVVELADEDDDGNAYDYSNIKGTMVTYEVDSDDVYTLTAVGTDKGAFDAYVSGAYKYVKDGKSTIGGNDVADDAVIFFVKADGTGYKVITGAELKKASGVTVTKAFANENESTGFKTVMMAYVNGSLSSSSDYKYAYVTANPVNVYNEDEESVHEITLWDGESNVLTTKKGTNVAAAAKGAMVQYKVNENGLITEITAVTDGATSAVTAFDGEKIVFNDGTEAEIDDDTVIIAVNSKDVKGADAAVITLADKDEDDKYIDNVYYGIKTEGTDTIVTVIFVDDANEMQ